MSVIYHESYVNPPVRVLYHESYIYPPVRVLYVMNPR